MWGSNPSLSGQSSGFWVSSPLSDSGVFPVWGWPWWGECVSASPTPFHMSGLPSVAHTEELPIQVSVFFRGSGSRCGCRFGVFRGGGDQDPFMSPSGTGTLDPSSFFKRIKFIEWHWLIAEDGVTLGGEHTAMYQFRIPVLDGGWQVTCGWAKGWEICSGIFGNAGGIHGTHLKGRRLVNPKWLR